MKKLQSLLNQNLDILNLLNTMGDFIQIMDPEFDIIWMNDVAIQILKKFDFTPVLQQNIFEVMPFLKDHQENITQEYLRVINKQEIVITEESNEINGHVIHTRTTKLPLSQNGKLFYIITIVNDNTILQEKINDELQDNIKLETIIKQLEHSNKMLEDFAHIVSHDLQEPLRTIVSFLDIVKEHSVKCDLDSNMADFIDRAYHCGLRMQKMINELLLLSKLNKQIEPIQKIEIDMHKLLNYIIDDLHIKINETNTQIILKDLQSVYGEYQLIRQTFLNMINNAIDHRDGNTPVIAIDSVDNIYSILYIIQDNGKGMNPEQIDQAFYLNSEWEPPTSLNGGMGVPICRRAVALHGGAIYVNSDGQTGTTIYVSLPTEKFAATPENAPEKA